MVSNESTGQEPWTAVDLRATSVTERAAFRRCRRQWFLTVVHRLRGLGGNRNFRFGDIVHTGLETWYKQQSSDEALEAYWDGWQEWASEVMEELGSLWENAREEIEAIGLMGEQMLTTYFDRDLEKPLGEVVEVEVRHLVPIVNPATGRPVRPKAFLALRLDLVVRKPNGRIRLVDHKTASQRHGSGQLDLDDQLTGYAYGYWRVTAEWPEDEIYNVLLKKLAAPPKLLKSGKLSQDKSQNTTYDLYRQAIRDNDLPFAEYAETLERLKGEGWDDYYIQEGVFRTKGQITEFERNLYEEWRDMRSVAAHPERAYPSPSPFNCPGCSVRLICQTMMDEGDAESIVRDQFVIGEERY